MFFHMHIKIKIYENTLWSYIDTSKTATRIANKIDKLILNFSKIVESK